MRQRRSPLPVPRGPWPPWRSPQQPCHGPDPRPNRLRGQCAYWRFSPPYWHMAMQAGFAALAAARTRPGRGRRRHHGGSCQGSTWGPDLFLAGIGLMFGDDLGGFEGWSGFRPVRVPAATPAAADPRLHVPSGHTRGHGRGRRHRGHAGRAGPSPSAGGHRRPPPGYTVAGHWVWGGGWLSGLDAPMIDFAGGARDPCPGPAGWPGRAYAALGRASPAAPSGAARPLTEGLGSLLCVSDGWDATSV
jgi:Amt family ammonium transporter